MSKRHSAASSTISNSPSEKGLVGFWFANFRITSDCYVVVEYLFFNFHYRPVTQSALKQLKAGTSSYLKQYEYQVKQLEKTPRTEIPARVKLVVEVKGLNSQQDPSKSLDGQES